MNGAEEAIKALTTEEAREIMENLTSPRTAAKFGDLRLSETPKGNRLTKAQKKQLKRERRK